MEPKFAALLPQLRWSTTPLDLAKIAAEVIFAAPPEVTTTHLHDPLVPVRPQAEYILKQLKVLGDASFEQLCADAPDVNTIVSRFLAILDLYREGAVSFKQEAPLAKLSIHWTGSDTIVADMRMEDEEDAVVAPL